MYALEAPIIENRATRDDGVCVPIAHSVVRRVAIGMRPYESVLDKSL